MPDVTYEQLEKLFRDGFERLEYYQKRDRRGSNLSNESFANALAEIDKKMKAQIDVYISETNTERDKRNKDIQNLKTKLVEAQEYRKTVRKSNDKSARSAAYKEVRERKKLLDKAKEEFAEFEKHVKEATNAIKEQAEANKNATKLERKADINSALTGGRSDAMLRKFDDWKRITEALKGQFGDESWIGKLANKFGNTVNTTTETGIDNAAKVGYAQMIIDAIVKGFSLATELIRISTQQNQNDFTYLSQGINLRAQMATARLGNEVEIANKQAQAITSFQKQMAEAKLANYKGNLDAQIMNFSDITGGAYKALDNAITLKYAEQRANIEKGYAIGDKEEGGKGTSLGLLQSKLGVALGEKGKTTKAQRDVETVEWEHKEENAKLEKGKAIVNGIGTVVGGVAGATAGGVGMGIGAAAGSQLGNVFYGYKQAQNDYYYGLQEQGAKLALQSQQNSEAFINQTKTATTAIEEMSLEAQKQIKLSTVKTQEEIEKALANLAQTIDKEFAVDENFANEMGKSLGYFGAQLNKFEDGMFHAQVAVSKFGKKMEDMAKLQNEYVETTGRNVQLTTEDYMKSFGMGTFWGDDTIGQLNSGMDIFNHSVADSNEMFFEMHKSLLKMGLNGKKFGKDLVNNLKLAEKYNFKGGVKGLMEMSKWAQNVRFNTASLDGMLDKVNEGGLEGIVKQAAELQVLGGNFAMGSDPFAMAWEASNDAGAYAKRVNGMLAGLGVFNSQTGEGEVRGNNFFIAQQAAKSLGMSTDDVIKQIKQEVKANRIKGVVGDKFNDEQLSMLTNKAKYVDGQWKVNLGRKDANGNDVMTNINDVTSDDLKVLVDDTGKSLEQLAIDSLSLQRKQQAAEEEMKSTLKDNYKLFYEQYETRVNNALKQFFNNKEDWGTTVYNYAQTATKAAGALTNFFGNGDDIKGTANDAMKETNNKLEGIETYVLKIAEKIGAEEGVAGKKLASVGGDQNLLKVLNLATSYDGKTRYAKLKNAMGDLKNMNSKWYTDPEVVSAMNTLRADPRAILKISKKDPTLRSAMFKLIYGWDDEGNTTNFDYHKDDRVIAIGKKLGYDVNPNHYLSETTSGVTGLKTISEQSKHSGAKGSQQRDYGKAQDGLIYQNGSLTRIDSNDQVLAAKNGGPIDKMLDMVQPRPMAYNSHIMGNLAGWGNGSSQSNGNGQLEIKPLSININGNIQLNGTNVDFTSQMQNDPHFKEALWKIISIEVSKRADNSGRSYDPLYNRIQAI